ncbi:branched-chain amino acid ABC transporter permease [Marinibaculum pumilum]|uniref:Branched-chain amino acid ABC transporter permease n=1 Tax=Marinibaculum pumilum TaxID=1766165 RepID=A0ABV7L054_9PROT
MAAAGAVVLLAVLPLLGVSNYVAGVGVTVFVFIVAALSLNVVYGLLGLLSLAHTAFWGIGGYFTAVTVVDLGWSFWLALPAGGLFAGLVALVIGYPALRLNRHSFVVVTLVFSLLTFLVARDWMSVTRGPMGMPGLPPPVFFGVPIDGPTGFYYLALAFLVATLALFYAFFTSRIAATMRAISQNEPLVRSQGINPTPYKLLGFFISAVFTGMAGAILVFHVRIIDPLIFDFFYMQAFLIMVIVGGRGSFWGVLAAGAAMSLLPELLRVSGDLRMVVYGLILLAVVSVAPAGFAGWLRERRNRRLRLELRQ